MPIKSLDCKCEQFKIIIFYPKIMNRNDLNGV